MKRYLNLGCGSHTHSDWTNVDIVEQGPGILKHDVSRGIPFPDLTFDVVYCSHLLEHLRRDDGTFFIRECHRVLKPAGILRIAVPDLEAICRAYLSKLEAALRDEFHAADYEWMMLEMVDQMARERSGGQMIDYFKRDPLPNKPFIRERIGEELSDILKSLKGSSGLKVSGIRGWRHFFRGRLLEFIAGRDAARALEIGRFRLGGEAHQWMYDRRSLSVLMKGAGFKETFQQTAFESQLEKWSDFCLDTTPEGKVRKPDSLFMEAVK